MGVSHDMHVLDTSKAFQARNCYGTAAAYAASVLPSPHCCYHEPHWFPTVGNTPGVFEHSLNHVTVTVSNSISRPAFPRAGVMQHIPAHRTAPGSTSPSCHSRQPPGCKCHWGHQGVERLLSKHSRTAMNIRGFEGVRVWFAIRGMAWHIRTAAADWEQRL